MTARFRHLLPWFGFALLIVSFLIIFMRVAAPSSTAPVVATTQASLSRNQSVAQRAQHGQSLEKSRRATRPSGETTVISAEPAPMPVGFLLAEISPSLLTEEEEAAVWEAQEKFAAQMARSPSSDTHSPEYRQHWKLAILQSDSIVRLRLGTDGFNRLNSLAAQEKERVINP